MRVMHVLFELWTKKIYASPVSHVWPYKSIYGMWEFAFKLYTEETEVPLSNIRIAKGKKWRDRIQDIKDKRPKKQEAHVEKSEGKQKARERFLWVGWASLATLPGFFVKGRTMDKQPHPAERKWWLLLYSLVAAGPWRTVKAHKPITTKRAGRHGMWISLVPPFVISFHQKFRTSLLVTNNCSIILFTV